MPQASRQEIRFLLGGEVCIVRDATPTTTILSWLRDTARRTGTKEGCAEGDCGACTVLVGRIEDGNLVSEPVNACIRFLASIDGLQLETVEDLGGAHPVQRAMVEHHGSQCGFCTPGFVMSLAALKRTNPQPTEGEIDRALAGNLCRCTGYAPIVAAAMAAQPEPAHMRLDETIVAKLRALDDGTSLSFRRDGARWDSPRTTDELASLFLAFPDARLVAGATDVGLWATKLTRDLPHLIYVGAIDALRRVEQVDNTIEIGAAVTYADIEPIFDGLYPDFARLIRRIGGAQVRSVGTLAGNVANGSPIGDGSPALIALGAELVLRRGDERRALPIEEFFVAYGTQQRWPGEFIETIRVPLPAATTRYAAAKIGKRFDQDISSVCAALRFELVDGAILEPRLAFGGMDGVPRRAARAEAALQGRSFNEAAFEAAMLALDQDFSPIDDHRASASYRTRVARNLLLKFYRELAGETATRLEPDAYVHAIV
ncbi:xanthine dehydrogenase small subunit [Roseiterribacter gracilis]|uniref:Xanthine dehydrogenase small subunit n=1 Tax=Roseiterribacter gracilis TaxID=2812848 RepID=A0A8S8XDE7_9PROT|nr:xanthine dehydrogenase small subunit [Rhodospirillales bacterium TMPK1]